MNEQASRAPVTAHEMAAQMSDIQAFDPGVAGYNFQNMGDLIRFGEIMAASQGMVPDHLRGQGPICVAVAMRAIHWKMDPYALAAETFVASSGGVVGYQAKVFTAVAVKNGITFEYEFHGEIKISDSPAKSAKGNIVAARSASGNRQVTVSAVINGIRLTYTTPKLDDITIKNSPLWHADPDQQLCYYGARGWMRRHRPDLMMGAYSVDEAIDINRARAMRDVTPTDQGFSAIAKAAQAGASRHDFEKAEAARASRETTAATDETPDIVDIDTETDSPGIEIDEGSPAYHLGIEAGETGLFTVDQCPNSEDPVFAANWRAGHAAATSVR